MPAPDSNKEDAPTLEPLAPTLDFLAPTLDSPARSTSQASESSVPDLLATPANLPATAAYPRLVLPAPGPGALFGTYELLEKLGQGGMGIVYRARDLKLGREVALKVIRDGGFAEARQVERFYQEARAAARLDHPNILPIYEIDQHAGQHFFTMKLIAGGSLLKSFPAYVGDARKAAELMGKVARAVHEAHANGILHRDLKPGNILLDELGDRCEPLVADFGLAKLLGTGAVLTETGLPVGTPAYMAPEQAAGESEGLTPASDVWGLGVILYELLTGVRPFAGMSSDEILRQIKSSDPTPPRFFKPKLDRDLETICLKCLEKEPSRRYATAQELAEDLRRWRAGEPVRARAAGWHVKAQRFIRRYAVRIAALLFLTAVGAVTVSVSYYSDPKRIVERQQRSLQAGNEVILIPSVETRPHRWWVLGEGFVPPKGPGQPLLVNSQQIGLLELFPSVPTRGYVIRGEIRQEEPGPGRRIAGIYFAHRMASSAVGPEHWFHKLTFSEELAPAGDVSRSIGPALTIVRRSEGLHLLEEADTGRVEGPIEVAARMWHPFVIAVEPGRLRVYWDGRLFRELSDQETALRVKGFSQPYPGLDVTLRGGLGIYVQRAAASIRSLSVGPLD